MYEMYPDTWALTGAQLGVPERPRRRPRKAHSVLPPVLARQVGAVEQRHVSG